MQTAEVEINGKKYRLSDEPAGGGQSILLVTKEGSTITAAATGQSNALFIL